MNKKSKKFRQRYICLTLLKPDIRELIVLFKAYLQDVEIIIDGFHLSHIAQLEQYDPGYRVQLMVLRGYYCESNEVRGAYEETRRLVELKISRKSAVLIGWQEAGKKDPYIIVLIKRLLSRCQNHTYCSRVKAASMSFSFGWIYFSLAEEHLGAYKQSIEFLVALCLIVLLVFTLPAWLLKLDESVFLFPGLATTTKTYGRREMIGIVVVTVVVHVMLLMLSIALHMLWT
jgi:hypothetical protein